MRPEKKKVRHHDSRKREQMAKEKEMKKSDKDSTEITKDILVAKNEEEPEIASSCSSTYKKRNIVSNWTKYEIPSSDDEEDEDESSMTGLDFNYVLGMAQSSQSLFRTKAEKEWEIKQNAFTSEFFSLDLKKMGDLIESIPLYEQIGMNPGDIDEKSKDAMDEKAKVAREKFSLDKFDDPVNDAIKILKSSSLNETSADKETNKKDSNNESINSSSSVEDNKLTSQSPVNNAKTKDLEDWLDDFLSD